MRLDILLENAQLLVTPEAVCFFGVFVIKGILITSLFSGGYSRGGGGGSDMKCYNCQGSGHMSRECTEPRSGGGGGGGMFLFPYFLFTKQFFILGGYSRGGGGGGSDIKCYNCQGSGHMSRECTEPRSGGGGGGGKSC